MRRVLWVVCAANLLLPAVTRAALPDSVETFEQRVKDEATSAEGALHLWFEALFVFSYADEERSQAGAEMLDRICSDNAWRRNELFLTQLHRKPWIFRSYADGATPENGYGMDAEAFALVVERVRTEDDDTRCTIDLRSSGADALRPVPMLFREGHWWVANIGNLYAGVQEPNQ